MLLLHRVVSRPGKAIQNHTAKEEGWTKFLIFQTVAIFVTILA